MPAVPSTVRPLVDVDVIPSNVAAPHLEPKTALAGATAASSVWSTTGRSALRIAKA